MVVVVLWYSSAEGLALNVKFSALFFLPRNSSFDNTIMNEPEGLGSERSCCVYPF